MGAFPLTVSVPSPATLKTATGASKIGMASGATVETEVVARVKTADLADSVNAGKGNELVYYRRTQAEITAGVVPVSYFVPSHDVCGEVWILRYGTNVIPGTTNMTTAYANMRAVMQASSCPGRIPPNIFMVDPFTFGSTDSGTHLYGSGFNPQFGTFGLRPTILRARTASAAFVTVSGCYNLFVRGVAFDGNRNSDDVLFYPGTVNVNKIVFEWCNFYGCTPTTGKVHHYGGTLGGDTVYYHHCQLSVNAYPSNVDKAANLIHNTNSNAFNIVYEKCQFWEALKAVRFGAGSCDLIRCDFYQISTAIIEIDSITQPFKLDHIYTEQCPGVPVINQAGIAGVTSAYPIQVIGGISNSTNDMNLNCQQPVVLVGYFSGGNIIITPMATFGTQMVVADCVGFAAGKSFGGTGAVTNLSMRSATNAANDIVRSLEVQQALTLAVPYALTNAGATPSVQNGATFSVTNAGAQNVTNFINARPGQVIILMFNDANTTIIHNVALINLKAAANFVSAANKNMMLIFYGNVWQQL